jgi:O-antigen/teichoic acid export membrane protein
MKSMRASLYSFLRWSERYTKTDMVYLARGGFWSIIGQVVSTLATLGLAIIVAHVVPKTAYGDYKYVIATIALLSTFSLNGLGSAVFQSVARGFDGALQEGFWANIRWSLVIFLGALTLAVYYFFQHNTILAFGMLIGGCLSPLLTSANFTNSFLNAKKDFARASLYFGVIETLVSTTILIGTILITTNPIAIIAAYFVGNFLPTLWLYKRTTAIYSSDHKKNDPGMLSYGKHLSLMGILNGIASNIDQILLFHFSGPINLALYNFATAIPDQTKGPLKTLDQMMQAQFARRSDKDIRNGMRNKTFWLLIFSIFFIALYILCAPWIYKIFFPKYLDAVIYSQIYSLSLIGTAMGPATSYLAIKKKVREQYINNIAVSLIQIGALFVGVYYWGLLGLVIARTTVRAGGMFLNYVLYSIVSKKDTIAVQ